MSIRFLFCSCLLLLYYYVILSSAARYNVVDRTFVIRFFFCIIINLFYCKRKTVDLLLCMWLSSYNFNLRSWINCLMRWSKWIKEEQKLREQRFLSSFATDEEILHKKSVSVKEDGIQIYIFHYNWRRRRCKRRWNTKQVNSSCLIKYVNTREIFWFVTQNWLKWNDKPMILKK